MPLRRVNKLNNANEVYQCKLFTYIDLGSLEEIKCQLLLDKIFVYIIYSTQPTLIFSTPHAM